MSDFIDMICSSEQTIIEHLTPLSEDDISRLITLDYATFDNMISNRFGFINDHLRIKAELETKNQELDGLRAQQLENKELIVELNDKIECTSADLKNANDEIESLRNQFIELQRTLDSTLASNEKLTYDLDDAKETIESYASEIAEKDEEIGRLTADNTDLSETVRELTSQNNILDKCAL